MMRRMGAILLMISCLSVLFVSRTQGNMNGSICFSFPHLIGEPDAVVTMGLQVSQAELLFSVDTVVTYPADLLTALSVSKTAFSTNMFMEANLNTPGEIRIAMAGSGELSGSGELLSISFRLTGASEQTATVGLSKLFVNDVSHSACVTNGSITIHTNRPPVADAGPDQTVDEGVTVTLDASNSHDPDVSDFVVSYSWTQTTGPAVDLSDPSGEKPTFTAPDVGSAGAALTFQLIVYDQSGLASAPDTCIVNIGWVNLPPVADAGLDQEVKAGDLVTLDGSGSYDPDGAIASYVWSRIDGPPVDLSGATTPQPTFTAPEVGMNGGSLTFQLTVSDQEGLQGCDSSIVNVTWVNSPPMADAGEEQTVEEGSSVTLDASNSSDPDDGIESYTWTEVDGPPVTLITPTAVQPTFTAPNVGPEGASLNFQVTVKDRGGLQSQDTTRVNVTWVNHPPVMSGPPVGPNEGEINLIRGFTASATDPDNDDLQYRFDWGDSTLSEWNAQATASYQWCVPATYCVKAQARDVFGAESTWSECTNIDISQPSLLTVTITPQAAIDAGAMWRVDGGEWKASGQTLSDLAVGPHTVEFKEVVGWSGPQNQTATIVRGETTSITGAYSQLVGSLTVTITPQAAIDAGAMWRVDGGTWQISGAVAQSLITGEHSVEFKDVPGWTKPLSQSVSIAHAQTTTLSGASAAYVQKRGSLKVLIRPSAALAAGARWNVDGGQWLKSGSVVSNLSVGRHIVRFKNIPGWTKPKDVTITINDAQTLSISKTYVLQTGSLMVMLAPQAAIRAGAQWRVDGGKWQTSGTTVSKLRVGFHIVSFKAVKGWKKPADTRVQIRNQITTKVQKTYGR